MAWRLRVWRRMRTAPGVTVNVSRSGPSVSVGPRGAKVTVGRGGVRETVGLPGTGVYATNHQTWQHVLPEDSAPALPPPPPNAPGWGVDQGWTSAAPPAHGPVRSSLAKRLAVGGVVLLFGGATLGSMTGGSGTGFFAMLSSLGLSALFAAGGLWAWGHRSWGVLTRSVVAGLAVLFAVSGIGSAMDRLTATPTAPSTGLEVRSAPSATPSPQPHLTVSTPSDGETVSTSHVIVTGMAPSNALVVRDISMAPDASVVADGSGRWSMAVNLSPGENTLVFRVGSDRGTALAIHVVLQTPTLAPPASAEAPEVAPSASLEPAAATASPTPAPTPSATPVPTPKPTAAPVVLTVDDLVSVDSSKTRLRGAVGSYTWSDVSFDEQLGTISWAAKAPAKSGCRVVWRLTSDDASNVTFSAKPAAGATASGTKKFQADYGDYQLAVSSTCPSWSSTLVSKAPPPYWNPWGYNFTPGNVIYKPPADFCSYFDCIASFWDNTRGYVMQCRDLMFSHSGGRSGSCSWHGGNKRPLYRH